MSVEELIKRVAKMVEERATVKTVFGDPIKLDHHTIVPVAKVVLAGGGGGGGKRGGEATDPSEDAEEATEAPAAREGGGGGGGTFLVTPLGFIHEKDGDVVFSAIESRSVIVALLEKLPMALAARLSQRLGRKPPPATGA